MVSVVLVLIFLTSALGFPITDDGVPIGTVQTHLGNETASAGENVTEVVGDIRSESVEDAETTTEGEPEGVTEEQVTEKEVEEDMNRSEEVTTDGEVGAGTRVNATTEHAETGNTSEPATLRGLENGDETTQSETGDTGTELGDTTDDVMVPTTTPEDSPRLDEVTTEEKSVNEEQTDAQTETHVEPTSSTQEVDTTVGPDTKSEDTSPEGTTDTGTNVPNEKVDEHSDSSPRLETQNEANPPVTQTPEGETDAGTTVPTEKSESTPSSNEADTAVKHDTKGEDTSPEGTTDTGTAVPNEKVDEGRGETTTEGQHSDDSPRLEAQNEANPPTQETPNEVTQTSEGVTDTGATVPTVKSESTPSSNEADTAVKHDTKGEDTSPEGTTVSSEKVDEEHRETTTEGQHSDNSPRLETQNEANPSTQETPNEMTQTPEGETKETPVVPEEGINQAKHTLDSEGGSSQTTEEALQPTTIQQDKDSVRQEEATAHNDGSQDSPKPELDNEVKGTDNAARADNEDVETTTTPGIEETTDDVTNEVTVTNPTENDTHKADEAETPGNTVTSEPEGSNDSLKNDSDSEPKPKTDEPNRDETLSPTTTQQEPTETNPEQITSENVRDGIDATEGSEVPPEDPTTTEVTSSGDGEVRSDAANDDITTAANSQQTVPVTTPESSTASRDSEDVPQTTTEQETVDVLPKLNLEIPTNGADARTDLTPEHPNQRDGGNDQTTVSNTNLAMVTEATAPTIDPEPEARKTDDAAKSESHVKRKTHVNAVPGETAEPGTNNELPQPVLPPQFPQFGKFGEPFPALPPGGPAGYRGPFPGNLPIPKIEPLAGDNLRLGQRPDSVLLPIVTDSVQMLSVLPVNQAYAAGQFLNPIVVPPEATAGRVMIMAVEPIEERNVIRHSATGTFLQRIYNTPVQSGVYYGNLEPQVPPRFDPAAFSFMPIQTVHQGHPFLCYVPRMMDPSQHFHQQQQSNPMELSQESVVGGMHGHYHHHHQPGQPSVTSYSPSNGAVENAGSPEGSGQ